MTDNEKKFVNDVCNPVELAEKLFAEGVTASTLRNAFAVLENKEMRAKLKELGGTYEFEGDECELPRVICTGWDEIEECAVKRIRLYGGNDSYELDVIVDGEETEVMDFELGDGQASILLDLMEPDRE